MKKFTKLALAASVALSANAMAMQAMDDSALSSTTGQDGINIGIGISKVTIDKLFIHDNDGLDATLKSKDIVIGADIIPGELLGGTGTGVAGVGAGAIVIQGVTSTERENKITLTALDGKTATEINNKDFGIYVGANYSDNGKYLLESRNLADLQIDADGSAAGAFLNIAAQVSGLEIHIGEIGVAASNKASATSIRRGATFTQTEGKGATTGNYNAILSGLSIKTGNLTANIQLGSAPQGAMIKLDSVIQGGLTIENLGILDNSTKNNTVGLDATGTAVTTKEAGEIFIKSIKIADASSKDLKVNASVKVFNNGYAGTNYTDIKRAANITIVSTSGAHDMYIEDIRLGSRANGNSIGDVEIQGMQTYYGSPMIAGSDYQKGSMITISGR